jgi:hypothetical protein
MSFSLQVSFGGLLHYVVNSRNSAESLCRLCIVLPNAPAHQAQIRALRGVFRQGATDSEVIDFAGKRVVFQFSRNTTASQVPGFDFEGPIMQGSVRGVIPFERILGTSADHNHKIVRAQPSPAVNAQILIGEGGVFSLAASSSPPEIGIPGTLLGGGGFSSLTMAELISMQVDDLDSARIVVLPIADAISPEIVYSITPSGGQAELLVSHDCAPTGTLHVGDDDKDFRFHYTLLEALPPGRRLEDMPLPKINKFSGNSENFRFLESEHRDPRSIKPNGCNCAGSSGLSRSFDLDKFMTVS